MTSKPKKKNMTRIFFVTDIHGSDICFRKFLNCAKIYKADVIILGGDVTGKLIVPVISRPNGVYTSTFLGQDFELRSEEEVKTIIKKIRDSGYYPSVVSSDQYEELKKDGKKVHEMFITLMKETLAEWVSLAEQRLNGTDTLCFITGGNDDYQEVVDSITETEHVKNPEDKIVQIGESHKMVSLGWGNITPWKCPRDISEEELEQKIEGRVMRVNEMENCIFNFHVPPINSTIDSAPKLDSSVYPPKPIIQGGQPVMFGAGSVAVRGAIEKYQPLLGLQGHIHESRGMFTIGNTSCFNPGSEYSEGILRGLIVSLKDKKVIDHQFTSG